MEKEGCMKTPTPADSASTLATIERCVTEGGASIKTALESAYQLGVLDGGTKMILAGLQAVEKIKEAA